MNISNNTYKGTKDLYPEDFKIQEYIFDTWKSVCKSFGYEQYLTPLLENADIYRAKSGDDVGNKELFVLEDKGGRELALRPEMTPSVTRMISKKYKELPKPMRLFSVANFYRNERPQRGRNREFWQLNADIFGEESINADIEILTLAINLMLAFNPPEKSFKVVINNRKLINYLLVKKAGITEKEVVEVSRVLDKYEKLDAKEFMKSLEEKGLDETQIAVIDGFMKCEVEEFEAVFPEIKDSEGYQEVQTVLKALDEQGYSQYLEFSPSLVRGLDYYNGIIFEVFDQNLDNNRSLFGGGRYNGLAQLFGIDDFPAVGFAPGDETMKLFLESWNLIPEFESDIDFLVTLWPEESEKYFVQALEITQNLRQAGKNAQTWLSPSTKLEKQLTYADKKKIPYVIIVGPNELASQELLIKNMLTGDQEKTTLEEIKSKVS